MSVGKAGILTVLLVALVTVYSNLNDTNRLELQGKVVLGGKPLDSGLVVLYPEEGTTSTILSARIEEGKFLIEQVHGPVPGDYRVEVYQTRSNRVVDSAIPTEFNTNSTLKLNVPKETRLYAEFNL